MGFNYDVCFMVCVWVFLLLRVSLLVVIEWFFEVGVSDCGV